MSERVEKAPTLEEVREYCEAMNYKFDIDKFFNYYAKYNWLYMGMPIDWKVKAEEWNARERETIQTKNNSKVIEAPDYIKQRREQLRKEIIENTLNFRPDWPKGEEARRLLTREEADEIKRKANEKLRAKRAVRGEAPPEIRTWHDDLIEGKLK